MKLYHGTSTAALDDIITRGILPRNKRPGSRSLWPHAPSAREAVYLTDAYAPYFAVNACGKKHSPVIVEVDTERFDRIYFAPDEDVLEQAGRGRDNVKGDMARRTEWYRRNLFQYADGGSNDKPWRTSLKAMGTCAYLSGIPAFAITRVLVFDRGNVGRLGMHWDASITLINYRLLGAIYRKQTGRLFGDHFDDEEISTPGFDQWKIDVPPHRRITMEKGEVLRDEHVEGSPDERVFPTFDEALA